MVQDENSLYVGVVGYFDQKFDEKEAREILEEALDDIEDQYVDTEEFEEIVIVSGLTSHGIIKIAYEIADERDYLTVGVAPQAVNDTGFDLYDVDVVEYVGKNFGDESEAFVDMIDVLIKVGGGSQSESELVMAEADGDVSILEFDLESQ